MAGQDGKAVYQALADKLASGDGQGVVLQWDLGPEAIVELAKAAIAHSTKLHDAVAATAAKPSTAATLAPLIHEGALWSVVDSVCTFPQHVSSDEKVRDAATAANELISAYGVEAGSRHDVYLAISALAETKPSLETEEQRFLDRTLRDFRRKGLHLDEATRGQVLQLNKRMKELSIRYEKNLGEEKTKLLFADSDLEGLPDSFLAGLEEQDGKRVLTLKYPHYIPLMKQCKVAETRRLMEAAFNSRCVKENTPIIEELGALRHEVAQLLGYDTHASFITEIRMVKTSEAVRKFLAELSDKLTPLLEKDMANLLALKKEFVAGRGEEFDGTINPWDSSFYRNLDEARNYQVDHEAIKEYFPLERVVAGVFDIYQTLLGLKFTQVEGAATWHPEVQLFQVDNSSDGSLVGYFYLDLHPRDGKFGHAAVWGLQPSVRLANGKRLVPVAGMVCNFTAATPENPSLLTHDEVETMVHEAGHVFHQICSLANIAEFAGTSVERDFVEAPSQMLENWAWDAQSLAKLSGRLSDGAPLPEEHIKRMVAARQANAGINNKRQISLASLDQELHSQPKADTEAILRRLTSDLCHLNMSPGTNMTASFGHLAGGYDAQYYGYLYSEVFSMDMFESRFKAEGIFSPGVGLDYRQKILQPGGTKDAADMLRDFLGRDPSPDAFLRSKGLEV